MTTANPVLLSSGTYYLIEYDGAIVACGGWTKELPGKEKRIIEGVGHIRHFATHPKLTGKGFGKQIVERCISDAQASGLSMLECFSSLNAEGFYRSMGFEIIERTTVPMSPTVEFPCILMRRSI